MAFFTPRTALACLVMVLTTACFEAPRPNCAFLCGTGAEACPDDYTCGLDNRCHLVMSGGQLAQCDDVLPGADAAIDGGFDGGFDAAVSTHSGTISVTDLSIAGFPQGGHGLSISIELTPADPVPASFDSAPGSPVGCKVFTYEKPASQPQVTDRDHGVVKITGAAVEIPDCVFVSGRYTCLAGGGVGTAIIKNPPGAPPGTAAYATVGYDFTDEDLGRYIAISGAANAANNGAFPIVGHADGVAIYANPAAVNDAGSTFSVFAGGGPVPPVPGIVDPLPDDATITVAIEPAEDGAFDFPDVNVAVGDTFTLEPASLAALNNLPIGSDAPVTFTCGDTCGQANGTLVLITTSDGEIQPGLSPFALPPVAAKTVVARCAVLGGPGSVTIPKEVLDLIEASRPTRIRTLFLRAGLGQVANPGMLNGVNVVAGHAVVGFTNPVYECTVDANCSDLDNACKTHKCENSVCVIDTVMPTGTPLATQTAGDCKSSQCGANGAIVVVAAPTDVPNDNLDCTLDTCSGMNPQHPPAGAGSLCNDGGGKFCDGDGECVECNIGPNCTSGVCSMNECQAPNCMDGVKNGPETDTDCGGTCSLNCDDGEGCMVDGDCTSEVCEGMKCQAPTCFDMTENGTESDEDCGGICLANCGDGKACNGPGDCASGVCSGNICQVATCTDDVTNGNETDEDCGGGMCPVCTVGDNCMVMADCDTGVCDMGVCQP